MSIKYELFGYSINGVLSFGLHNTYELAADLGKKKKEEKKINEYRIKRVKVN